MRATWVFAVASLITSRSQISGLESPRASRSRTSRSRGVSSATGGAVFFLLAAGALALTQMRRALGWSAIGVALLTLIGTAVAVESVGQFSVMLWFAWIVYASIAIAHGKPAPSRAVAVAHTA
jgi:hypothetical protein